MEAGHGCGAARQRKGPLSVLFVAAALLATLGGALLFAQANVETPKPTPYVRRTYEAKVPFFTQYWWVGFVIMILVFLLVVMVLYAAVQHHFKHSEQLRRRKEIEMSRTRIESSSVDDKARSQGADQCSRSKQSSYSNPLHTPL
ncbi:hypothetical protein LMJF_08_0600 [Leishmania major strain Friedlin]|uniref:Transmembrane protein n=1 Tax=Leishmania major TaxID=5664 RepID=Q4QIA9_LEIMA|nr:hypothetical protein LMJF_08_0600 [Leishmania major strain Friedlin]CAG9569358.1 hypothetical_protein_-_conserved [Leishmania major strain Friedlin]CAJ02239.1 hypothetical protein LMJF_08_0600 [Leishmania major strain Friedlin]|eukprot:XP_001681089.1 hypothetical protein LMJF_08_0600 [Leishmania major strain Friedlin]